MPFNTSSSTIRLGGAHDDPAMADLAQPPIIPFHLSCTAQRGIHSEKDTANLFDITDDDVEGLHMEVVEYIDNLEHRVREVFAEPNRKLCRRMHETKPLPSSFLYMRCMQQGLKLSGQVDAAAREKEILHNLSTLLDA
eukprot:PhM_4_TR5053/c0_g1_i1/m.44305